MRQHKCESKKGKKQKGKRKQPEITLPEVVTRDPQAAKRKKTAEKPADRPPLVVEETGDAPIVPVAGYGLKKKPKSTPKRKKKKVKTPKKAAKPSPKAKKPRETALQKWHKQKKTARKMRL